jgi:hypothetical protein
LKHFFDGGGIGLSRRIEARLPYILQTEHPLIKKLCSYCRSVGVDSRGFLALLSHSEEEENSAY